MLCDRLHAWWVNNFADLFKLHSGGSSRRLNDSSGIKLSVKLAGPNDLSLVEPTGVQLLDFCYPNKFLVPCVEYLPTERDGTQEDICYEMLRFIEVPSEYNTNLYVAYKRHCGLVDCLFRHYFLMYLNHSELNMAAHVDTDISNMEWFIFATDCRNRLRCSHRDVCLNILCWMHKDQGRIDRAVECFRKSLEIVPVGNTAVWHLRDIETVSGTAH